MEDVLGPELDSVEGELSAEAMEWCDYWVNTYVGRYNPRTGKRGVPKIKPSSWIQFEAIQQGMPHTTNAVEGFNSAWGASCPINQSLWTCISNLRREEEVAKVKWRQNQATVEQHSPGITGTSRQTKQRAKMSTLRNLVDNYQKYETPAAKRDYLLLVSSAALES